MTEERWSIDTPDGHKIHGVLNKPNQKKNTKAVLHIHGLTGSEHDYAAVRMAMIFPKKGYDVIRPNLYYWLPKARSLVDCTIKIHADDINTMINYFKTKYKALYATGHSYGGPSLMEAKTNSFKAMTLWDPTYIPQKSLAKKEYIQSGKFYLSPVGSTTILGKAMLDEAARFDRNYAINLAKKCKTPLQVIYGGRESFWIKEGESFHTHAKGPTEEHVIKESQHCFHEEGTTEPLLRYTRKWFDQF